MYSRSRNEFMTKQKDVNRKKPTTKEKKSANIRVLFHDERLKFIIGVLLCGIAVYILIVCASYLISWQTDQSLANTVGIENRANNWGGRIGNSLAEQFIAYGFGFGAFFIPLIFGVWGLKLLNFPKINTWRLTITFAFSTILLSLILGYIFKTGNGYLVSGPGGEHGYVITDWLNAFIGEIGTAIILIIITFAYIILTFNISPSVFTQLFYRHTNSQNEDDKIDQTTAESFSNQDNIQEIENDDESGQTDISPDKIIHDLEEDDDSSSFDSEDTGISTKDEKSDNEKDGTENMVINRIEVDDILSEDEVNKRINEYDPRLDLSHYQFPPISILKDYKSDNSFSEEEVYENKDKIKKTLSDFKIAICDIKATVGPTVTLYEIVPERGVKLARIKSLEDDIALNLHALGIRIIAPIPGRGTVGIEVPNKSPQIVTMRSLVSSKAFQETKYDIPLALGRTITNEPYIADLTKMPHLLVAGATGQGKSVGINAIIASILYKKHPAEVKFVLIDPKRVELPLYMKIERHYLAKLPGEDDAIITDTQKVISTLNSLCIEMDHRLEMLKAAQVRNIKEYNEKFISRKLNPEKGHKFLPYIVLIIDEFADLIMTAGREIEGPIGRLAQLARAIGIHLIISTQRPSVTIITGFIKANFPTRIAFRVFSSVDSRTILDSTGAERLVGRGDMLISSGAEPIRVQCAFVDTTEIEELTDFIGNQQGYPEAFNLPEYIDDNNNSGVAEVDLKKRDPLFEDAARLVVMHQQGSTSLIQRKLQLGYNRAGRIIDQLEAAGIVGPFEGSKAREVLYSDPASLEQLLNSLS